MYLNLSAAGSLLVGLVLLGYGFRAWRRSKLPFGQALRSFLAPPTFSDPAASRRASLLSALIQPVAAAVLLILPLMALLRHDQAGLYFLVLGAWSLDATVAIYLLARRGQLRLACWLYPATMFALGTSSLSFGSGSAGLATYPIIIVVAGLLLGGRGALIYALLSSLVGPAVLLGPLVGLIAPGISLTWAAWLEYVAVYVVTAVLLRLLIRRFEASIQQAEGLQVVQAERSQELDRSLRLERKRTQQLELLADSARRLTGINDPQALVDEAARRLIEGFNFEHAAVFLVEGDRLVVHGVRGVLSAARPLGSTLALGEGIVGLVGLHGELCWVRNVEHDERCVPVAAFPVKSLVAVPLRFSKSVVGVLEVASTQTDAFELTDVQTLESLADLITVGLQASQLFIQLSRRQQASEALRRIGAAVNQSLDLDQIVNTVCLETSAAFNADQVEVWLADRVNSEQLERAATASRPGWQPGSADSLDKRRAMLEEQRGSRQARLVLASQTAPNPAKPLELADLGRSVILAPLNRERGSLGLLTIVEWQRPQPFTAEDAAAAEFLASHLAAAVSNARLYADGRRRADELALLSNITSAALEIADYATLLKTLADRLGELFDADGCYLALWDSTHQTARLAAFSGGLKTGGFAANAAGVWEAEPLTEAALNAGHAFASARELLPAASDSPAISSAAGILSLPLIADGQWLGAAHLLYRQARRFTDDEISYAERAGRQIALAMSKARALEAERRRNAELQALHAASLRFSSSLDLRQVLESILQQALSLAGGEDAHIFLYDGHELTFGAALWADGSIRETFTVPRSGGLTEMVAQTAQRIVVPDVNHAPLYQDWRWGGAIVGLPLNSGDRVCGVMNVAFTRPHQFDEYELRLLDLLADQAAVALENARLFRAEREQRELAEALRSASLALSGSLEFEAVLDQLLGQIERVVPFDAAAILLVQPTGAQVRVARSRGYEHFGPTAAAWLAGASFDVTLTANLRRMVETQQPLIVADTRADLAWSLGGVSERLHSWAGVPIVAHQQVMAFFTLHKEQVGYYRQEHADRLAAFAGQAALALQNARLFEAERRRAAQLTLLSDVSQQVTGTLDEDLLLQRVVKAMISRLGFAVAGVLRPVPGDELEIVAMTTSEEMMATVGFRQKIGAGVIGHAVEIGATYLTNDVGRDPYYFDPAGRSVGSALALLLRYETELLGVLYLETSSPGAISAADVIAYETLANHIAVAMQNARLFKAEREQRELAEALRLASLALSASLDYDTVLDRLLEQIGRVVPYDSASIMLMEGGQAKVARLRGYDQYGSQVAMEARRLEFDVTSVPNLDRMVRTASPVIVSDTAADPDWVRVAAGLHVRSWAGAPIIAQGQVVAFFSLEKQQPGFYQAVHGARLAAFAGQAALALANARLYAGQRRRAEEQRLLLMAARDFSAALSEGTVLQAIAQHMTQALESARCSIYEWDRGQDAVINLFDYLPQASLPVDPRGATYSLTEYPATRGVLLTRQPLVVNIDDSGADPNERRWLERWGQARLLSVPLYTGDDVFGLVEIQRSVGSPLFTETDQSLALSLAAQAAVALENAQLHTAVQENVRELDALLKANEALLSTLELDPLLRNILGAAIAAIPSAEMGTILLYDAASQQLRVRAAYGYHDPRIFDLTFAQDQGYSSKAMRENRPLLIPDVSQEPRIDVAEEIREMQSVASAIVAPLVPKGQPAIPHGVISLDATRPNVFTAADLRILVAFANTAAVAIENARLHAEVQRLAVTDSLTALANPRAFEHALAMEAYRAARYGHTLSLIIMDIDSFKLYNDTYGHLAGNDRLRAIADILRDTVRDPDLPVRYGGEEFALLLPHTQKAGAVILAERIRELAQSASPSPTDNGRPISGYTLSLGVATLPTDALSAGQLLLAADNAELHAKRTGKNRVCTADPLVGN